jgi:perosamine synthetase
MHSFFSKYKRSELKNLENFYKRMLHIPCGWWVTADDREKILDTLKKG